MELFDWLLGDAEDADEVTPKKATQLLRSWIRQAGLSVDKEAEDGTVWITIRGSFSGRQAGVSEENVSWTTILGAMKRALLDYESQVHGVMRVAGDDLERLADVQERLADLDIELPDDEQDEDEDGDSSPIEA